MAYVAGFNARRCSMEHEPCRNTLAYRHSGQNLGSTGSSAGYQKIEDVLRTTIGNWYKEQATMGANAMKIIRKFGNCAKECGHFTEMVRDTNDHIGCAVVRYQTATYFQSYVACNYAVNNMRWAAVYATGASCSQCPKGSKCSKKYSGLCSTSSTIAGVHRFSRVQLPFGLFIIRIIIIDIMQI